MAEANEQAFEVVLAGFLNLAALDVDVIDQQFFLRFELVEVEAEGANVLRQFLAGLLEGHEHAGLAELRGPADEKLHRQQCLSAAGAAADERRPATRQPAASDL